MNFGELIAKGGALFARKGADALADTLETAPAADLARIQASVSWVRKDATQALRCFAGFVTSTQNPGYANRSYRLIIKSPKPFLGFKLMFYNNSENLPFVVNAAKVSASATLNTSGPTGGTWYDVTQNGAKRLKFPKCATVNEPNPYFSDFIPCASVARTDGGVGYLAYLDGYVADNVAAFTASIAGTVMTVSAVASGYIQGGQALTGASVAAGTMVLEQITGNAGGTGTYLVSISQTAASGSVAAAGPLSLCMLASVANPNSKLTSEAPSNYYRGQILADYAAGGNQAGTSTGWSTGSGWGAVFFGVDFVHADPTLTCHIVGDSVANGDGDSDTPLMGGTTRACFDLTTSTGRAVIPANHGFSSQKTDNFLRRLKLLLDAQVVRGLVVFHSYSPNNRPLVGTFTQAHFDGMFADVVRAHEMMVHYGVPHIFRSSTPRTGFGLAEDNLRKEYDAKVKAWCLANGVVYADVDAVLSNGASPASYAVGASDDGMHPNDAGYDLEAPVMAAAIQAAVPAYFA